MCNGEYLTSDGHALSIVADLGSSRLRIGPNIYSQPRVSFPPLLSTAQGVFAKQLIEGKFSHDLMNQDCTENSLIDDCLALADFVSTVESDCALVHTADSVMHAGARATAPFRYAPPLVVIPPRHYTENKRCELLSILFAETSHESIAFVEAPAAHLFSVGKPSGVVLDAGGSLTTCSAVWEGYSFGRTAQHAQFGGFDTSRLIKLLYPEAVERCSQRIGVENGHARLSYLDDLLLRQVKRQLSEVHTSFDGFADELPGVTTNPYELPDGSILHAGVERFLLAEPLLIKHVGHSEALPGLTALLQRKTSGTHVDDFFHGTHLPSMVQDTCASLDENLREHVRHTVLTCGGGLSYIKNLNIRLRSELVATHVGEDGAVVPDRKPNRMCVSSSPHGSDSAWLGAALASSVPGFAERQMTRKEIEEEGVQRVIARKCA